MNNLPNNEKILIIDDEEDILKLLSTVLKKEGLDNIYTAKDAVSGYALFESIDPDIIILDIMLPDGNGIEEKEIKHIFDRYYRGTNTGTKHKGSGLGMAIAKDIVEAHNGTINIKSQSGVGTELEIIL